MNQDFIILEDNDVALSTKSILALFETDKEQRGKFVQDIMQRLEDGQANPLEVHLQIKAMEDIITQLTSTDKEKNKTNIGTAKRYKEILSDTFKNYCNGQKSFDFHNSKFTTMEAGTVWHYENTNDPILSELYEQQQELKKKVKERELFLQNLPGTGTTILDESTGQVVQIYKPYKTSTTTISVKLK